MNLFFLQYNSCDFKEQWNKNAVMNLPNIDFSSGRKYKNIFVHFWC